MIKVAVERSIPYLEGLLDEAAEVVYLEHAVFTKAAIKDCDALIVRSVTHCDRDLLEGTKVSFIATATSGMDHIDLEYCRQQGIPVVNALGSNAQSVAEYVISALAQVSLESGKPLAEIKRLGIVGVGQVGSRLARLAEKLSIPVMLCDPPRVEREGLEGFFSLAELASSCDVISFHTPLTRDGYHPTYHMVGGAFCQQLQPGAILINSCRGSVWDTAAVLQATRKGILGSLVVDCWESEPNIDRVLLDRSLIATPHIAGFSKEGKAKASLMAATAVAHFFSLKLGRQLAPEGIKTIDLSVYKGTPFFLERTLAKAYDLASLTSKLKAAPEDFSILRKSYPRHQEWGSIQLEGAPAEEESLLRSLGFLLG